MSREGKKNNTHTHKSSRLPKGCEPKKNTHQKKPITQKKPKKGYVTTNHNRWLRWSHCHPGHLNNTTPMTTLTTINQGSWWHPPGLQTINDVSHHRYGWRRLTLEVSQPTVVGSNDHGYNSCAMIFFRESQKNIIFWRYSLTSISMCLI